MPRKDTANAKSRVATKKAEAGPKARATANSKSRAGVQSGAKSIRTTGVAKTRPASKPRSNTANARPARPAAPVTYTFESHPENHRAQAVSDGQGSFTTVLLLLVATVAVAVLCGFWAALAFIVGMIIGAYVTS